jgi:hypothetical protein
MSTKHQFFGAPVSFFDQDDDLTDDSTDIITMVGLKTPTSLRERFKRRLSRLLSAAVKIEETKNGHSLDIYLSRPFGPPHLRIELDEKVRECVRGMKTAYASIALHSEGMSPYSMLYIPLTI